MHAFSMIKIKMIMYAYILFYWNDNLYFIVIYYKIGILLIFWTTDWFDMYQCLRYFRDWSVKYVKINTLTLLKEIIPPQKQFLALKEERERKNGQLQITGKINVCRRYLSGYEEPAFASFIDSYTLIQRIRESILSKLQDWSVLLATEQFTSWYNLTLYLKSKTWLSRQRHWREVEQPHHQDWKWYFINLFDDLSPIAD